MTSREREQTSPAFFDRAVDYYDQTRSLTDDAMAQVVRLAVGELAGRGRCLEIGVGTGRVALPLSAAGIDMAGIDVSRGMLAKLLEKSGGAVPWPLAQADARRLPFPDDCFGSAVAALVLHLIIEWEQVLGEILRAVAPGGVFLMMHARDEDSLFRRIANRFRGELGLEDGFAGVNDPSEVDAAMAARGFSGRDLEPVVERREYAPGELIARLEQGLYSWTWSLEDDARRRAADAVRRWADRRYGSLDERLPNETVIAWRAYDL